jgi:hypothetical protein
MVSGRVGELCTSGGNVGGQLRPSAHPRYVEALSGSTPVARAEVDAGGHYQLTLEPGHYVLRQGAVLGHVVVAPGGLSRVSFFCGEAFPNEG